MLTARQIFDTLKEWPHRGAGSEEEMEAREALMAQLAGEYGVHVTDEGFFGPTSYLKFFWILAIGQAAVVLFTPFMPAIMLGAGFLLFLSHLLYFDWRVSPLIWWGARSVMANVSASKGQGHRLVILMAHLDSAPASFAYRPAQVRNFKQAIYIGTAITGLGVLVPALGSQDIFVPPWLAGLFAAAMIAQAVVASIDYWQFGYTPGANDNLTGVAAATEVASRLWKTMPEDTEVRLVITSCEEAGMLGAQHYWRQHRDELKTRDTHLLNFDTVGYGKLKFVTESGGFTPVYYDGPLLDTARALTKMDKRYDHVGPMRHHVGDFDSVWFIRDGFSALTLAAYDEDGLMPYIHTPEDKAYHVDLALVEDAVTFGEAIIRTLPKRPGGRQ
ncbi:MAG: M28 family peptidase [Alphaproteobacteria bacterium]|nr:M28 family peptidase [Alphaproteobacteria bacterium]